MLLICQNNTHLKYYTQFHIEKRNLPFCHTATTIRLIFGLSEIFTHINILYWTLCECQWFLCQINFIKEKTVNGASLCNIRHMNNICTYQSTQISTVIRFISFIWYLNISQFDRNQTDGSMFLFFVRVISIHFIFYCVNLFDNFW